MYCPYKFIKDAQGYAPEVRINVLQCEKENCQWWNERFGMCCVAVEAYIKGQEDWSKELDINRRGG